jgi:hypothetical protein
VIHVGIDDTDTLDTPGTNQLARALVQAVALSYRCLRITRHQLLDDPRVPYTSHNGSASILLEPLGVMTRERLIATLRERMRQWFVPGSDPGLCVAEIVPESVVEFARRCQREIVEQAAARALAANGGLHLEGLGGTEGGVIGALAAVGLSAEGDDGRLVQIGTWPDDLSGLQNVATLEARGVEVRCLATRASIRAGVVDVGKHLRANLRRHRAVLFVQPSSPTESHGVAWTAVRLK